MSTDATVGVARIPGPLPLMGSVSWKGPFSSLFKSAQSKEDQLKQLERAVKLYIQVLDWHEADPTLKTNKIQEAQTLLDKVLSAKDDPNSSDPAALQKIYRKNLTAYLGDTDSELLADFENKLKELWATPVTSEGLAEGVSQRNSNANATRGQAPKIKRSSPANKLIRKIFGLALAKTLSISHESNVPGGEQDIQAFHRISTDIINSQEIQEELRSSFELPELIRQNWQLGESSAGSSASDQPVYPPSMSSGYKYPAQPTYQESEDPQSIEYNRTTSLVQPMGSVSPSEGEYPFIASDNSALQLTDSTVKDWYQRHNARLSKIVEEMSVRIVESDEGHGSAQSHRSQHSSDANASIISGNAGPSNSSAASSTSGLGAQVWTRTHADLAFGFQ